MVNIDDPNAAKFLARMIQNAIQKDTVKPKKPEKKKPEKKKPEKKKPEKKKPEKKKKPNGKGVIIDDSNAAKFLTRMMENAIQKDITTMKKAQKVTNVTKPTKPTQAKATKEERAKMRKAEQERKKVERDLQKQIAKEQITQLKNMEKERKRQEKELRAISHKQKRADKLEQKAVGCHDSVAERLAMEMRELVLSKEDMKNLTQRSFSHLRTDVLENLKNIRKYAAGCNPKYESEKTEQVARKPRDGGGLFELPTRDEFIPDINEEVPDDIPITEAEFEAARKRLDDRRKLVTGNEPVDIFVDDVMTNPANDDAQLRAPLPVQRKKKKKRVIPTFIMPGRE